MSDKYRRASSAKQESWDLAQYVVAHNRVTLVNQTNEIVGTPCYAVAVMQGEFLSGQMEPREMIDYARVCCEILFFDSSRATGFID